LARPEQILAAPKKALVEIARHGILAEKLYRKMLDCAKILKEDFEGDLSASINGPLAPARKALRKFPGIGDPGADKLLLFAERNPVLALDSNGLRVLVRLGFAEEQKSYSSTYRLVQKAIEPEIKKEYAWLIRAHQLLRQHGQELCKRSVPLCSDCPLRKSCPYANN
jgi:endonuclease III